MEANTDQQTTKANSGIDYLTRFVMKYRPPYSPASMPRMLYDVFAHTYGIVLTAFGIIISLVPWYINLDKHGCLKWFIPILFFISLVLAVFMEAFRRAHLMMIPATPKISKSSGVTPHNPDFLAMLLLEPTSILSEQDAVAFYCKKDAWEKPFCTGIVIIVQNDHMIQIGIDHFFPGNDDIIAKLNNNDSDLPNLIFLKPQVPANYIEAKQSSKSKTAQLLGEKSEMAPTDMATDDVESDNE